MGSEVRLLFPHGSVVLILKIVPRIGEQVHHQGRAWRVQRIIHVLSDNPSHVRLVLEPVGLGDPS